MWAIRNAGAGGAGPHDELRTRNSGFGASSSLSTASITSIASRPSWAKSWCIVVRGGGKCAASGNVVEADHADLARDRPAASVSAWISPSAIWSLAQSTAVNVLAEQPLPGRVAARGRPVPEDRLVGHQVVLAERVAPAADALERVHRVDRAGDVPDLGVPEVDQVPHRPPGALVVVERHPMQAAALRDDREEWHAQIHALQDPECRPVGRDQHDRLDVLPDQRLGGLPQRRPGRPAAGWP